MADGEAEGGSATASGPGENDETDPDKDAGATPTDEASDPHNPDLNAGALSQPTSPETP